MLELNTVMKYINPQELQVTNENKEYLSSMLAGIVSYVELKCNIEIDEQSPAGLIHTIAKMMTYNHTIRPQLQELKTEDMGLVFNTKYPSFITDELSVYRRVTW